MFRVRGLVGGAGLWLWQTGPLFATGDAIVIDGDNLKVEGINWRLAGLNAPELPTLNGRECRKFNPKRGCVDESSLALTKLVKGRIVVCRRVGFDWRNGRPIGVCTVGDIVINEWLLRKCHAGSPPNKQHRLPHYEAIIAKSKCIWSSVR